MSIYKGQTELKNMYIWTTPIKKVYKGSTQIRPAWWKPWANTLVYLPLESDVIDKSQYSRAVTISWSISYSVSEWVTAAYFNRSTRLDIPVTEWDSSKFTVSAWCNLTSRNGTRQVRDVVWFSGYTDKQATLYINHPSYWNTYSILTRATNSTDFNSTTVWKSWWHLITYTISNKTVTIYLDWVNIWNATVNTSFGEQVNNMTSVNIWCRNGENWQNWWWYIKDYILESRARTSDEISDYYNQTKSLYGIS